MGEKTRKQCSAAKARWKSWCSASASARTWSFRCHYSLITLTSSKIHLWGGKNASCMSDVPHLWLPKWSHSSPCRVKNHPGGSWFVRWSTCFSCSQLLKNVGNQLPSRLNSPLKKRCILRGWLFIICSRSLPLGFFGVVQCPVCHPRPREIKRRKLATCSWGTSQIMP